MNHTIKGLRTHCSKEPKPLGLEHGGSGSPEVPAFVWNHVEGQE